MAEQMQHKSLLSKQYSHSLRRGGYLVTLSDGDVPFFRVSFSSILSRTGYQKKAEGIFSGACQKGIFC